MSRSRNNLTKPERKHQKNRQAIIAAARILFENKLYVEVSMEDIADEAALSKQTLYNYFSNKEAIYFGIGIDDFKGTFERVQIIRQSNLTGREQVLKLSEGLFNALINFELNNQIYRRFLLANNQLDGLADKILYERRKRPDGKLKKKKTFEDSLADYLENVWQYESYWRETIELGFADGTISSVLTSDQLLNYIFLLIGGIVDQIDLKKIPLERSKLDKKQILILTLGLVTKLLDNK
ncbi:MAG: TetR/AcrR family transcriptional regulator [Candidatus Heimdallarchaeota archaeon]|nr:TetR/AcrR family transcriptional regulator [Candidatus Heimdallarchaeota archaeon]